MRMHNLFFAVLSLAVIPGVSGAQVLNGDFSNGTNAWIWSQATVEKSPGSDLCSAAMSTFTPSTSLDTPNDAFDTSRGRFANVTGIPELASGTWEICRQIEQQVYITPGTQLKFEAKLGEGLPSTYSGAVSSVTLYVLAMDINTGIEKEIYSATGASLKCTISSSCPQFHVHVADTSQYWGKTVKLRFKAITGNQRTTLSTISIESRAFVDNITIEPSPLATNDQYLWLVPRAANTQQQGFVRLTNRTSLPAPLTVWGIDAAGRTSPSVTLILSPLESRQLTAEELEQGSSIKGLVGQMGSGIGDWTLVIRSSVDVEALAYIRTPDGFLTSTHDRVAGNGVNWFVPMFNPAENPNQVSRLRVINTNLTSVSILIRGVDDAGVAGTGGVLATLAPLSTVDLSSTDLENGNAAKGLSGKLGNGTGKWQLDVKPSGRITVQSLLFDPIGKLTNLSTLPDLSQKVPGERILWFVPPALNVQQQGFVRLINREKRASQVAIWGIDDTGRRSTGTVTFTMRGSESKQITSSELESGSVAKGLSGSLGVGIGNWRLVVLTDLDLVPMALIRTPDGFLTSVHDTVTGSGLNIRVPIFNPADNPNQVSILRVVNPNTTAVGLTIRGVDDAGLSAPSGSVSLTLAAGAAIELNSIDLENGNVAKALSGKLGNGTGKWVLTVEATSPVKVMSLLSDSHGFLTNLSTGTKGAGGSLNP